MKKMTKVIALICIVATVFSLCSLCASARIRPDNPPDQCTCKHNWKLIRIDGHEAVWKCVSDPNTGFVGCGMEAKHSLDTSKTDDAVLLEIPVSGNVK